MIHYELYLQNIQMCRIRLLPFADVISQDLHSVESTTQ